MLRNTIGALSLFFLLTASQLWAADGDDISIAKLCDNIYAAALDLDCDQFNKVVLAATEKDPSLLTRFDEEGRTPVQMVIESLLHLPSKERFESHENMLTLLLEIMKEKGLHLSMQDGKGQSPWSRLEEYRRERLKKLSKPNISRTEKERIERVISRADTLLSLFKSASFYTADGAEECSICMMPVAKNDCEVFSYLCGHMFCKTCKPHLKSCALCQNSDSTYIVAEAWPE